VLSGTRPRRVATVADHVNPHLPIRVIRGTAHIAPKLNKDWADYVGGRQQGAEYKSKMFIEHPSPIWNLSLQPSPRWSIAMRKTLLALAAAATLAVSAASPAYAQSGGWGPGPGPRTYPGPGGYPHWSGYIDAPVGEPTGPCYWVNQRFWDGNGWRVRRVRVCG